MVGAAVLVTIKMEAAGFRGLEPQHRVHSRHHVLLDAEGGHGEIVDDVLGGDPDAHLLASGVTTTVDAGTAGWKHFLNFKEGTIDRSKVRILAFINIACCGMVDADSEQRAIDLNPSITASLALAYPENDAEMIEYFLNSANHKPGTQLDMISYHFYAQPLLVETPDTWQYTFFHEADRAK